ncbi:hypothetical protein TNCV_1108891 [Trichonephila clavipes]|nr:hypothetical protein TNCV_1108891 [Trichonephila clavipes]
MINLHLFQNKSFDGIMMTVDGNDNPSYDTVLSDRRCRVSDSSPDLTGDPLCRKAWLKVPTLTWYGSKESGVPAQVS